MPRTFVEWKRIQTQWMAAAGLLYDYESAPTIPNESVIYQRRSTNPYWQRRYDPLKEYATSHFSLLNGYKDPVATLFSKMSKAERSKEEKILSQFFPPNMVAKYDTIELINNLLQGQQHYEDVLERINEVLTRDKSHGAPNMSSVFTSYLSKPLKQQMSAFKKEYIENIDNGSYDAPSRYEYYIDQAFQDASNAMANASVFRWNPGTKSYTTEISGHGGAEDWAAINKALRSDPFLWDLFVYNTKKAIGNWDDLYDKVISSGGSPNQATIKKALKLGGATRMFSVGGNVVENAMAALAVDLLRLHVASDNLNMKVVGGGLTPEGVVKTDSMILMSAETNIDIQQMFDYLNSSSQKDYMNRLVDTMQAFKQNTGKLFGIFINAKNRSIGEEQDPVVTLHDEGSFEDLPGTLSQMDMNINNVEDFLLLAYNTGAGALGANQRDKVEESLTAALKAGIAKMMFDKYSYVGSTEGDIIHLYQIDSVFIPASVVFESIVDATNSDKGFEIETDITLPDAIEDPGPKGWEGSTDAEIKETIYQHWEEEIEAAKEASTWYYEFTWSIKEFLRGYVPGVMN